MSYELFEIPEGYKTTTFLAIAPYYCDKFIDKIKKELKPEKIMFVVDDGNDKQEAYKIQEEKNVNFAFCSAKGLVHMKLFYVEYEKIEGKKQKEKRLFLGSANATNAAFSGNINAELIAYTKLFKDADSELIEYIENIIAFFDNQKEELEVSNLPSSLNNYCYLQLPAFTVKKLEHKPSFDAWLQRGFLASKYNGDSSFLKIKINLKNSLPKDFVAEIFENENFIEEGDKKVISFSYVPNNNFSEKEDNETKKNWKSGYCTWTHLGDWLSSDCYKEKQDEIKAGNYKQNQEKISFLQKINDDKNLQADIKNNFINALKKVLKRLCDANQDPSQYLEMNNKELNEEHYIELFNNYFYKDTLKAKDESFKNRYINGYEFNKVPNFRDDKKSWDIFVRSFCESLALEIEEFKQTKSKLAITLKKDCNVKNFDEIYNLLTKDWNKKLWGEDDVSVGEYISSYYDNY